WIIREVAALLQADLEALDELVRCCERVFFEVLCSAAEEPTMVLEIFKSPGQGKLGCEVILQVAYSTRYIRRGTIRKVSADDVVSLGGKREFFAGRPVGVAIKDVCAAVGYRPGHRRHRKARLSGKSWQNRIVVGHEAPRFLTDIVVNVP